MDVIIRRAKEEDVDAIRYLFRDTILSINARDYTAEEIKVWAAHTENIAMWRSKIINHYFIVAEAGGELMGFSSLDDTGYLDFMYVHKDYQRLRVASNLLAAIEKHAENLDISEIHSQVSKTAQLFFERSGFVKKGDIVKEVSGIVFINAHMVK